MSWRVSDWQDCRELQYEMTVRGQEIENLFMMTPYYYKTGRRTSRSCWRKRS